MSVESTMIKGKILFIIESLGSGGAERQLVKLASMLSMQNYDVHVCYYVNKKFYSYFLDENSINHTYLDDRGSKILRFIKLFWFIIQMKPDIVMPYLDAPNMMTCFYKIMGLQYKLIASERNTTQQLTLKEKIKFALYSKADYIVSNSITQNSFVQSNFPKLATKTKAITNYIDVDFFSPKTEVMAIDIKRCLCVGRITEQKNVLNFIYAVNELINKGYSISVDWYGDQSDVIYYNACVELVDNLALGEIVRFYSPTHNLQDIYRKADFFCLPSVYEGYPNTLCEAMSSGLPIVCSNVCDNPTIVRVNENAFLFDPSSILDITAQMENMLNLSKEQIMQMRMISRESAVLKFSKQNYLENYLAILE